MQQVISMEQSLPTKDESKNDGETSRGQDQSVVPTDAHVISMEQSLPTKDEGKNDGETSRGQDQTVVPTDAPVISTEQSLPTKDESKNDGETSKGQDHTVVPTDAHVISMEQSLTTKDESKNDGETSRGQDQTVVPTDAPVISMEQSLPTKDESKNDGETSKGQDQTVVPTDAEWTSPESDWVRHRCNIPMELRSSLDDMGNPIEKNEENLAQITFPKVPLRLRKFPGSKDYFDPTVISFGPYHHGKIELQEMESIKTEAMLKFIKESGKPFPEFYYKVRKMIDDIRTCYINCSKEKYCDDTFAFIMLRDGCFISYLLDITVLKKWDEVNKLFYNHGSDLEYDSATNDMVLLENQIPLGVLELLMNLRYNNKKVVPKMIKQFIYYVFWEISLEEVPEDEDEEPQAHCLLDCIQKEFSKVVDRKKGITPCFSFVPLYKFGLWNPVANTSKKEPDLIDDSPSYRSLSELKAKGIHFKPINYSPHSLKERKSFSFKDVEFIPGFFYAQLKLPPLFLTNSTVILWHNLIAFELSPACETEIVIISYINFLNALIANSDDVKELRSKHILLNRVGSDEEVFKKFKEIATVGIQDPSIYRNVRNDIEKHCRSKIRTWVAEIIYKYFRNPWSALGLFAAIAVVVLSFLQTYFTIYPRKDERMESICSYLKRQQIKND